ncbi:hypothetical protein RDI58_020510 [Solanum bulbocastanum]|uniref:Uncharacterized protein n=1 Tax=Solanum bulbocastanum TaxID=147425 RepID=A0AAN8T7A7_SOLBU
MRNWYLQEM